MSNDVIRQVLLIIVLPSAATVLLTYLACATLHGLWARRRPGKRFARWGDEWIWVGDLTGFRIEHPGQTTMYHQCGWVRRIPAGAHLSSVVADEALRHRDEGCANYPLADATIIAPRHGRNGL